MPEAASPPATTTTREDKGFRFHSFLARDAALCPEQRRRLPTHRHAVCVATGPALRLTDLRLKTLKRSKVNLQNVDACSMRTAAGILEGAVFSTLAPTPILNGASRSQHRVTRVSCRPSTGKIKISRPAV